MWIQDPALRGNDARAVHQKGGFGPFGFSGRQPMTRTATNRAKPAPGPAVVLFGLGEGHKPRAAYFPAAHAEMAIKAAELMGLKAVKVAGNELSELAAQLPASTLTAADSCRSFATTCTPSSRT
jgi:hypothetical protein